MLWGRDTPYIPPRQQPLYTSGNPAMNSYQNPPKDEVSTTALDKQVAGNHYKDLAIQPVEYIHANNIGYMEGNVIKYVSRWRAKNGLADLEKAKHYIELLIELETRKK